MKNCKLKMRHILLFIHILLSDNRCVFSSFLTGMKHPKIGRHPPPPFLRPRIHQETIITSMNDNILAMQKTMEAIKEENRIFKNQVSDYEKQMADIYITLKQQFQTELGTMKKENQLLKEQLSECEKQITNINITVKQQFQSELGSVKEENRLLKEQLPNYEKQINNITTILKRQFHTELEPLKEENRLFKEKLSKYEKQITNINTTLNQKFKTELGNVKDENQLFKEQLAEYENQINYINITLKQQFKTELKLQEENRLLIKQLSEYAKQTTSFNLTIGQMLEKQDNLLSEYKTHSGEIKDLHAASKLLKEKSSEYEKEISNINVTLKQIQVDQIVHITETNITKGDIIKINDISEANKVCKAKMSKIEEELADINNTIYTLTNASHYFILNGNVVRTKVKGALMEFIESGSWIEKINTTDPIGENISFWCSHSSKSGHWKIYCSQGNTKVRDKEYPSSIQPAKNKSCKRHSCPAWHTSKWERCSVTCGHGVSVRDVQCRNVKGQIVQTDNCDPLDRPDDTKKCNMGHCPKIQTVLPVQNTTTTITTTTPNQTTTTVQITTTTRKPVKWTTSDWSQCSVTCGEGRRNRFVRCKDRSGRLWEDKLCSHLSRPTSSEPCSKRHCGYWRSGSWGQCTASCGRNGVQSRRVTCQRNNGQLLHDHMCEMTRKPIAQKACHNGPCKTKHRLSIIHRGSQRRPRPRRPIPRRPSPRRPSLRRPSPRRPRPRRRRH